VAAVLEGLVKPGDVVMTPEPGQGCDLVFGHPSVAWAGKGRFVRYGPDPETLSFDRGSLERLVEECRPSVIVVSVPYYPRRQDLDFWRNMSERARALLWVDLSMAAGLVPGGLMPSPSGEAHVITGSTRGLLRGPSGGFILCRKNLLEKVEDGFFPRLQAGYALNGLAARAVALKEVASPEFREYAARACALAAALGRSLTERGISLWTGGTDFHLVVLDLSSLGRSGLEGQKKLAQSGILARRVRLPFVAGCTNRGNGLLLGTQALALKGVEDQEIKDLADRIYSALK
jgi:glycine hydroxymethyltransferase